MPRAGNVQAPGTSVLPMQTTHPSWQTVPHSLRRLPCPNLVTVPTVSGFLGSKLSSATPWVWPQARSFTFSLPPRSSSASLPHMTSVWPSSFLPLSRQALSSVPRAWQTSSLGSDPRHPRNQTATGSLPGFFFEPGGGVVLGEGERIQLSLSSAPDLRVPAFHSSL